MSGITSVLRCEGLGRMRVSTCGLLSAGSTGDPQAEIGRGGIPGAGWAVVPRMRQLSVVAEGPTDEALLAGMAVGDQAAAVAFVRRYQRRVFGLAYSMTNDAGVAEDVAQEALIRVWRHAPVFDA